MPLQSEYSPFDAAAAPERPQIAGCDWDERSVRAAASAAAVASFSAWLRRIGRAMIRSSR